LTAGFATGTIASIRRDHPPGVADEPVSREILISGKEPAMPLFEVETTSHIMIACVSDEPGARAFAESHYPSEEIIRVSHRPRDAWVISKKLLGISDGDICSTARDCLAKAQGDKLHAVRLYMQATGSDLDGARKVIETNMVRGW
jgi:capsular polysaccharide biosynthesis protein